MIDLIGLSNGAVLEQIIKDEDLVFRKINVDWFLMVMEAMIEE